MDKKLIAGIVAIVIIVVAIIVGIKVGSKKTENSTSSGPSTVVTEKPSAIVTNSPGVVATATPTDEPTVEPSVAPSPVNIEKKDTTQMSNEEKKDYAKSIAKATWEALGVTTPVYYSYDDIDDEGNYLIAVREEATTKELVRYKINIQTNSCEITF